MTSLQKLTDQLNDIANELEDHVQYGLQDASVEGYTKTLMQAVLLQAKKKRRIIGYVITNWVI